MKNIEFPIVLIHGQPGSSHDWDKVISLLKPLGTPRIFAPDRPGYTLDKPQAMSVGANARWLYTNLENKGIEKPILVAHSFGGAIALSFALQFPSKLSAIVLISSSGTRSGLSYFDHILAFPGMGEFVAATSILFAQKLIPLLESSPSPSSLPIVGQFLKNIPSQLVQDLPKSWLGLKLRSSPVWKSFAYEQRCLVKETPQLENSLPTIDIPISVIHGLEDEIISIQAGLDLARHLPKANLVPIANRGHFLPYEDPEVIVETIKNIQIQILNGV